jgi:phytoene synthase
VSSADDVADAYARCEALTRQQAANFFYGIRLLPHERRQAMCAVYAFARRVDDIGDGTLAREEKLRRLDAEDSSLAALQPSGSPSRATSEDQVMVALADASRRFSLPSHALGELIEGVRMDVEGIAYEGFDDLVLYCRRVAGAIGRLCLAIFGLRDDAHVERSHAEALADDLGVALQLTNILRDLREDAENGRVYLPAEDLRRFGLADAGVADWLSGANQQQLSALVRFEAERARQWFDRGLALVPLLDRRSAACVLAMAGIYRRLLERIDAHPEQAVRQRMSLPAHEKVWVALRGILGAGA